MEATRATIRHGHQRRVDKKRNPTPANCGNEPQTVGREGESYKLGHPIARKDSIANSPSSP